MDIFFKIHNDLPREGPGDSESTRKAFSFINNLPPQPTILDIACGPGMQTLDLARLTGGRILALDNQLPFLKALIDTTKTDEVEPGVSVLQASMFDLPFENNAFDVIWSEGAIYIIGFEKGLKSWKSKLKPGGFLAVTEISWLKPKPPSEIFSYWTNNYPGIRSIPENLQTIQESGYSLLSNFTLPANSWWTHYYTPIETRLHGLKADYSGDSHALKALDEARLEIDMYQHYSEWYGYVFYVMQEQITPGGIHEL